MTSAVLVALLVVGLLAGVFISGKKPKLGLDLSGGLSVVLTAPAHTPPGKLDEAVAILQNRINRLGVTGAKVAREGTNNISIEIANVKDPQAVLDLIGQTAQLEFRQVQAITTPSDPAYPTTTVTSDPKVTETVTLLGTGNDNTKYTLDPAVLTGADVQSANAVIDPSTGQWSVSLAFKSGPSNTWTQFTSKLACITNTSSPTRQIGIVLDNAVQSAPVIGSNVACGTGINTGTTSITGNFSQTKAKNLALVLQTGALPVVLTKSTVQQVSATLGKQSLQAGLVAGALGLLLVMLYVAIYYRSLGLQTWVGLIAFSAIIYCLVVILGATVGFSLSLAGIAGLIVAIGITTDSYVVFFERIKEEVHGAKTLRSSVDRGYKSALRTLFTADAITFFAAVILYILAVSDVRGFAFTLGLATALDVFLFIALTYPLAALLARSRVFSKGHYLGMTTAFEGAGQRGWVRKVYRSDFHIDFIGRRKLWLTISGVAVLISALALIPVFRGLSYGIDFKGGTQFVVPIANNATVPEIKAAVAKTGVQPQQVQIATSINGKTRQASVETNNLTNQAAQQSAVIEALSTTTGSPTSEVSVNSVGSTWGSQITHKALEALIVFLVVVVLYMSWRLETKMAAAGIIALFHDLIITAGIYAITGLQVTPDTVIAILTILGYSLYDTVVVFDKIKENVLLPSNAKRPYDAICNDSMNQVFMRSINTSLTTLLPVGSLLFVGSFLLGADTLRQLALALFVGIAAGTYSSIFVATPLLSIFKEREPRYAALKSAGMRKARTVTTAAGGGSGSVAVAVATDVEDEEPPARRPAPKPGAGAPKAGPPKAAPRPAPVPGAKRPPAKPAAGGAPPPARPGPESAGAIGEASNEGPAAANGVAAAGEGAAPGGGNGKPPARTGGPPAKRPPQPQRKTTRAKRKKGGR